MQEVHELSSFVSAADLKAGKLFEQPWCRGDNANSESAFNQKNCYAGWYAGLSATFDSTTGTIKVYTVEGVTAPQGNISVLFTKDLTSAKDAKWDHWIATLGFPWTDLK